LTLNDIFNESGKATIIYYGDCNVRGLFGGRVFSEGSRFFISEDDTCMSFIAEKISVKPIFEVSAEEFAIHVNGNALTPLTSEDPAQVDVSETCTVIEFSKESYKPVGGDWACQKPNRPH
jgi:hypothetical protein